jgi:predicted GH43/DUF377 family glycosyl hydrolase
MHRVRGLSPERASELLDGILRQFQPVNPGLEEILMNHADRAIRQSGSPSEQAFETRMLIGAYFSMEYAFESAALCNPSMVPAYDQSGLSEGTLRFIMSLRAVGEGHLSSITFRRGTIDAQGDIEIRPASLQVRAFKTEENRLFAKTDFLENVQDTVAREPLTEAILSDLPDPFSSLALGQKIERYGHTWEDKEAFERITRVLHCTVDSEYEIRLGESYDVEDMVLFPLSEAESRGMEDMRLVRLKEEDGAVRYCGTYTAYNGHDIVPQLLEVASPHVATVHVLRGRYARNKGMALFPRKVAGQYAMIGRIDGENLFLLKSDAIDRWEEAVEIVQPAYDWEFVQIGNCGSPLLTDAGWLLLTHGVGPMRQYCMGVMLLDLKDPTRVLGRLQGPLMSPAEEERSGYVPNVVYSCGALIHQDKLVIPYGISDAATGFATVSVDELLGQLC